MEAYSVLMSVYCREQPAYLQSSLESMFSQTDLTDDFVLVCDGSLTPELDAVIEAFTEQYPNLLHVVRLPQNQGLGAALNAGLAECRNDLVVRMDSDDISAAIRCERQVAVMTANPKLCIVGSAVAEFEQDVSHIVSVKKMPETQAEIERYAKTRNPFNHPSVMYRKSAVLQAGGYQNAPLHEDYDLWVRMLMQHREMQNLPEVLCYMRVDAGLYARRGGWRYWKIIAQFRRKLYRMGFCSLRQYWFTLAVYAVNCLIPVSLRRLLYRKLLRSSRSDERKIR